MPSKQNIYILLPSAVSSKKIITNIRFYKYRPVNKCGLVGFRNI
jgi:hypothetical protein